MEVADYRRQTTHVIGMGMSKCDRIYSGDATRPQIRRDHIFADVHLRVRPEGQATAVYQQRLPVRHSEEERIALAYINRCHFQNAGTKLWMGRNEPDKKTACRQYCGSGDC